MTDLPATTSCCNELATRKAALNGAAREFKNKPDPGSRHTVTHLHLGDRRVTLARADGAITVHPFGEAQIRARGASEREVVCSLLESMERSGRDAEALISALGFVGDSGAIGADFHAAHVKRMLTMISNAVFDMTNNCTTYRLLLKKGSLQDLLDTAAAQDITDTREIEATR